MFIHDVTCSLLPEGGNKADWPSSASTTSAFESPTHPCTTHCLPIGPIFANWQIVFCTTCWSRLVLQSSHSWACQVPCRSISRIQTLGSISWSLRGTVGKPSCMAPPTFPGPLQSSWQSGLAQTFHMTREMEVSTKECWRYRSGSAMPPLEARTCLGAAYTVRIRPINHVEYCQECM